MDAMATDLAAPVLKRISPRDRAILTSVPISPAEHFPFYRAFYRVELSYALLRCGAFVDGMKRCFFCRHSPWETEQLGFVVALTGI
jgi:hypothetical protein